MLLDEQQKKTGVSRRAFLKTITGTAAGIGISQVFNPALVSALEKALETHPVIWIQGQGCTGCSVSLLNSVDPSIADVLLKVISLQFHPTVMASEGDTAMENLYHIAEKYKGKFSLAVEGAIPVAADGKYCIVGELHHKEITMVDIVKDLGAKAGSVLALGTCAAYGGIPAAKGNETGATGVMDFFKTHGIKTPVVNIPGCPPHPDWIVGSIAHLLTKGLPELDDNGRPVIFYGENIHDNCPRVGQYDAGNLSEKLSDANGCRIDLGCKGPDTYADCYKRKWNSGMNWCVDNSVCIGCVEPGFPDASSPFYEPA
ncbi:MAG: hydrogenase small subunit [Proteobacteria bacterium]|nr:hydrogenase small subunit [Pseudomonadota bacterium]MBU1583253.1 hydrogenase small subunit [Pseudomonadota bacterium]MBU2629351.1 hydrogenase small subunit [Pseudomonadota bacterium]